MEINKIILPAAYPSNDPRSITQLLQRIEPKGKHRNKIALLIEEMKTLDIAVHPQAFCMLFRSLVELLAKAYCLEHEIEFCKENGKEKPLVNVLSDVIRHIETHNVYYAQLKLLHGVFVELKRKDGLFSIPSMNQVIHNLYFAVAVGDICMYFNNVFPLLEAMNSN